MSEHTFREMVEFTVDNPYGYASHVAEHVLEFMAAVDELRDRIKAYDTEGWSDQLHEVLGSARSLTEMVPPL